MGCGASSAAVSPVHDVSSPPQAAGDQAVSFGLHMHVLCVLCVRRAFCVELFPLAIMWRMDASENTCAFGQPCIMCTGIHYRTHYELVNRKKGPGSEAREMWSALPID
jgi:hypothetical protein